MKIYLCDSAEMFPDNVMFYSHYVEFTLVTYPEG